MDLIKIGKYIQSERKAAGLTQKQLAEKLNVSFQAVSKWENGDALPDAALLLNLADELNTTTDKILTGGTAVLGERRRMRVADVVEGFRHIEAIGRCFGEDSTFYTGMIEGINQKMNIDLHTYLSDPKAREALIADIRSAATQGTAGTPNPGREGILATKEMRDYYEQLNAFIRPQWNAVSPSSVELGGKVSTWPVVDLTIAKNGTVSKAVIVSKSGNKAVDDAVNALLAKLKVVPAPPQAGVIRVTLDIR
jgi:TonB family protein